MVALIRSRPFRMRVGSSVWPWGDFLVEGGVFHHDQGDAVGRDIVRLASPHPTNLPLQKASEAHLLVGRTLVGLNLVRRGLWLPLQRTDAGIIGATLPYLAMGKTWAKAQGPRFGSGPWERVPAKTSSDQRF